MSRPALRDPAWWKNIQYPAEHPNAQYPISNTEYPMSNRGNLKFNIQYPTRNIQYPNITADFKYRISRPAPTRWSLFLSCISCASLLNPKAGLKTGAARWKTGCDGQPSKDGQVISYDASSKFRRRVARGNLELSGFPLQTNNCFPLLATGGQPDVIQRRGVGRQRRKAQSRSDDRRSQAVLHYLHALHGEVYFFFFVNFRAFRG